MRLARAGLLLITTVGLAGCSKSGTTCVPLASVSSECPPDWTSAMAARDAFCAKEAPFFDTFLSTAACRGSLHYTRYLFDAGPRYCLYDPTTKKLTAYGAYDGKALFEQYSCGVDRAAFADQDCAGDPCPARPDAAADGPATSPPDAAPITAQDDAPMAAPDATSAPDGPASTSDAVPPAIEVRCDLVTQSCSEGTRCEFFCDSTHLIIGCDPEPPDAAKLGEPCGPVNDGGPPRLCGRGLGCFASAHDSARCRRYCHADTPCPAGTTCDTTSSLRFGCPTNGQFPVGICL